MKTIGRYVFPEQGNVEEARAWETSRIMRALASKVLCIAKTRIEGQWAAYVDAVPGVRHDNEWQWVERDGDKLREHVALAIFPEFEGIPYAS